MECGDLSPLSPSQQPSESGDKPPHSIRFALEATSGSGSALCTQSGSRRLTSAVLCFLCLLTAVSALVAGCAKKQPSPVGFPIEAPPTTNAPAPLPAYAIVPVFYATDREPARSLEEWRALLRERGSDFPYYGNQHGALQFGLCQVSVPIHQHTPGEIERPARRRLEFSESPEKHFLILGLTLLERDAFMERLNQSIDASEQAEALVFIHGYNVKFADAAMRAAQLSYDLGFTGAPILYSWASDGTLQGYPRDEETVQLTAIDLREFLLEVVLKTRAKKVHLVAHSMGNRALADVLRRFAEEGRGRLFSEVVLAAPDINREIFLRAIAPAITNTARRVTVYASSDDKALKTSKTIHAYPRVGESGPNLVVAAGIETIDASGIDTDLLAHSYFANARPVIADLAAVVCRNYPPTERRLKAERKSGLPYWRLRP
jgi:esterase/lipase superfamily enzyme